MRRRIFALLLALLTAGLLLSASAAGQEAGDTPYISDEAGILTQDQVDTLEEQARAIAEQYSFAVNIVVIEDYTVYSSTPYEAAKAIYLERGLGYGDNHDGVLLMLSMGTRKYANIAYGYGNYAFTDYGKEQMDEKFLDNFKENDWFGGFSDYLSVSEKYLKLAAEGNPYDTGSEPGLVGWLIIIGLRAVLPLIIATVYVTALSSDMRSVYPATDAKEYLEEKSVKLRVKQDIFTHTTRVEHKIERDRDSGGGTTTDSSGFSGTSGSF